jgi:hypothetical protein
LILLAVDLDWKLLFKISAFWSLPASVLWSWMISRLFPVWLSQKGIHGHSSWCVRRFVAWQDIEKVRKFPFFNLPYLRVYSISNKQVIWLPLFLTRPTEFYQSIEKLAPPKSPVLAYLGR